MFYSRRHEFFFLQRTSFLQSLVSTTQAESEVMVKMWNANDDLIKGMCNVFESETWYIKSCIDFIQY